MMTDVDVAWRHNRPWHTPPLIFPKDVRVNIRILIFFCAGAIESESSTIEIDGINAFTDNSASRAGGKVCMRYAAKHAAVGVGAIPR